MKFNNMTKSSKIINPFLHNNYTQLAKVYKMKREKFSLLIEPIRDEIKKEDPYRNTLSWKEIVIIVDYLGAPDPINSIDPLIYNSIAKLSELYRVERRIFSRWILPIKHKLKQDYLNRHLFTPREVKIIIDHLGLPVKISNQNNKTTNKCKTTRRKFNLKKWLSPY
jgi:hypothetical protein